MGLANREYYEFSNDVMEERVVRLEHKVAALEQALAHVLSAMLPAFQSLPHIEQAALTMREAEDAD